MGSLPLARRLLHRVPPLGGDEAARERALNDTRAARQRRSVAEYLAWFEKAPMTTALSSCTRFLDVTFACPGSSGRSPRRRSSPGTLTCSGQTRCFNLGLNFRLRPWNSDKLRCLSDTPVVSLLTRVQRRCVSEQVLGPVSRLAWQLLGQRQAILSTHEQEP